MRLTILACGLVALASPAMAQTQHQVRPYVRSDGIYVQPHYRTNRDYTPNNNWTTRPNVNPHTGREGTRAPSYGGYRAPAYGSRSR